MHRANARRVTAVLPRPSSERRRPRVRDGACLGVSRARRGRTVAVLKNAALTRLLAVLDIVFPEYGSVFSHIDQPTALAVLKQYPGPEAILRAKKRSVVALLKRESRGHLGEKRYETLCAAARATLALPGAQGVLADELGLIIARLEVFTAQLETLKQRMIAAMERTPEAQFLLTIPGVQPVTAATLSPALPTELPGRCIAAGGASYTKSE